MEHIRYITIPIPTYCNFYVTSILPFTSALSCVTILLHQPNGVKQNGTYLSRRCR
ncbi:hypothetical protein [Erwinia phage COW86c]